MLNGEPEEIDVAREAEKDHQHRDGEERQRTQGHVRLAVLACCCQRDDVEGGDEQTPEALQ